MNYLNRWSGQPGLGFWVLSEPVGHGAARSRKGSTPEGAAMTDTELMRVTADNYRRLADRQTDAKESERFLAYATAYDELATRREQAVLRSRE
jgi:hypothetical protein